MEKFTTAHRIITGDARDLSTIPDCSVDLAVTSPPYPMIAMWDELFSQLSPDAGDALLRRDGNVAFELMHRELDKAWMELYRVLKPGAFACVNIGDATRSVGGTFRLYSNHSRMTSALTAIGFDALPMVHWRKTTNAPNKFMGSGMLPAGAYVTLEHEYILVFRKAGKRSFTSVTERKRRNESALFWEERNIWFSDTWEIAGARQKLLNGQSRKRSGAFPLELPYRCINMYSLYGDVVLDPFSGTGTTTCAAIASGRSSFAIEYDSSLTGTIMREALASVNMARTLSSRRLSSHVDFVNQRTVSHKAPSYRNSRYHFPVMTKQETGMIFRSPIAIDTSHPETLMVSYDDVTMLLSPLPKDS